ncbi:MAG TPA: hypothetical protein VFP84_08600 [Kofleriaceae bacterium]|nr:hypothetical protein [Kofleriaceae bacterium]
MRLALGIGVAVLIAARGDLARADPAAPQVSPARLQQEDTQRIDAQQRGLAPDHDPGSAGGAARGVTREEVARLARELDPATAHRLRVASYALFSVAGAGALASLPLFATDPHATRAAGTLARVLAISAAGAAGAGFTLFMASRTIHVAPAVSPQAVSLSVVGPL